MGTFEMAATLGQEALGAYVISMATSPSDVLAVKLMQVSLLFAIPFRSPSCHLGAYREVECERREEVHRYDRRYL